MHAGALGVGSVSKRTAHKGGSSCGNFASSCCADLLQPVAQSSENLCGGAVLCGQEHKIGEYWASLNADHRVGMMDVEITAVLQSLALPLA